MKVMYLDESGDHNLQVIDRDYPIFVLGGVILESPQAEHEMQQKLDALKRELFGNSQIILHTSDITRNRRGFERLQESEFRKEFYARINQFMAESQFMITACAIRKCPHTHSLNPIKTDAYLRSLSVLTGLFANEITASKSQGIIIAERRGNQLDNQLITAWEQFLTQQGATQFSAPNWTSKINLQLRSKRENLAGLQLADLVVGPIGRHLIGKSPKDDFRIIERKLLRNEKGQSDGHGIVIIDENEGPTPATQSSTQKSKVN